MKTSVQCVNDCFSTSTLHCIVYFTFIPIRHNTVYNSKHYLHEIYCFTANTAHTTISIHRCNYSETLTGMHDNTVRNCYDMDWIYWFINYSFHIKFLARVCQQFVWNLANCIRIINIFLRCDCSVRKKCK